MKRLTLPALAGLIACAAVSAAVASSWPHDPTENLRVTPPSMSGGYSVITADGFGGAVVVWKTDNEEIWAQRIDAHGNLLWPSPGVPLAADTGGRTARAACPDGTGGAIVAWQDLRNNPAAYDIYAQRISGEGDVLWTPGGVRVCVHDSTQGEPYMVADGEGGAFFAFLDGRYGASDFDIMAQYVDPEGNRMWGDAATAVCAAYGNQTNPDVALTMDNMLVVVWEDERADSWKDTYAQKLDPDGQQVWINNGVAVANTMSVGETQPAVCRDDFGGAIVAWRDTRGAWTIYGQRLEATAGGAMWTAGGVQLVDDTGLPGFPEMVADGSGGATFAFWDDRSGSYDIGAQRVDQAGNLPWGLGGVLLTQAADAQTNQMVVADGTGGITVAWWDQRGGAADVYAQRVDGDGVVMWEANGVEVCTDPSIQGLDGVCSDGMGGLIAVWDDSRNFPTGSVYAQRVERNGYLGYPSPDMTSVVDSPADQGGSVIASWAPSWLDAYAYTEVTHYTAWRWSPLPQPLPTGAGAVARATAAGLDSEFVQRQAAMGWEYVGMVPAAYQSEYAMTVPSFGDSTADGAPETFVKTIAHTADTWTFWESLPMSGYSRDNLAPVAPLALIATRVGNYVRLDWSAGGVPEPDFSHYAVFRATSSGVTPEPIHFVNASLEETFWDHDATPGTPYYYIVTAVDVHENHSEPTNEAGVDGSVTGIDDHTPAITRLTVPGNTPNPFNAITELRIGLPAAGDVTVDVFDVAGRRVLGRAVVLAAGWQRLTLDARALPSGVYFCRVSAAGETVTRKIVIRR